MADQPKKDELDEVLGLGTESDSQHKLEDIDPVFSQKEKEHSDRKVEDTLESPSSDSNVPLAGATGAAAGLLFGPKSEAPSTREYRQAKSTAEVRGKSVERQTNRLAEVKAEHVSNVDTVHNELKASQARFNAAQQKLEIARQNAIRLNALPEPPPAAPAPTVGSTVPIDEGAMRHNVKMGNIVDYNTVRKGMTGTTEATSGMGRLSGGYTQSGRLIVPSELANAPLYNAEQLAAQKTLSEAEATLKSAQTDMNALQAKWRGMAGSTPKSVQRAELSLSNAAEKAAEAADKAASLKPTGLQRAGAIIRRIPYLNILAGGLTGAEAMHAYEQGLTPEGIMGGMGAAGGALMMIPHPASTAIGAALSVPPLIYQGYKYYTGE